MEGNTIAQRSPEWYEQRKNRITASAVGAILGMNPYRTPDDVMRQMVRDAHRAPSEFNGNAATAWGTYHEGGASAEYSIETGQRVVPCGFYVHPDHDWLGASPDGLVGDSAVIEIKCPYGLRSKQEPDLKTLDEQPHYWAQVQLQMACTGRHLCHFYQWTPFATMLEVVRFDGAWFYGAAMPKLRKFYGQFKNELNNPEHLEPKRNRLTSGEASALVRELAQCREDVADLKRLESQLIGEIVDLCNSQNTDIAGGHKVTLVERKGSISYARAIKDHLPNLDLEPYRGEPSSSWRVTVGKGGGV